MKNAHIEPLSEKTVYVCDTDIKSSSDQYPTIVTNMIHSNQLNCVVSLIFDIIIA